MNDKPTKYEDLKINCPHCNKQIKIFYPIPALSQYHPDMYISQEMEYYERKSLQTRWNSLREWLIQIQKLKGINQQGFSWGVAQEVLDKMNELEKRDGE